MWQMVIKKKSPVVSPHYNNEQNAFNSNKRSLIHISLSPYIHPNISVIMRCQGDLEINKRYKIIPYF